MTHYAHANPSDRLTRDNYLFSFAIWGDTHIKPEDGDQSSPWKVNDLATGRARWVAREMARYAPRFIFHLGDIVHPVPELPTFDEAVSLAKDTFQKFHNGMHFLPGNHDIGDKTNSMMPAKAVREDYVALYERNFGASWSSFDAQGCRFILINNPILNSGSEFERTQRAWLKKCLQSAGDQRIFMLMHYPLFLLSPDEAGHYDNIDEPARSELLDLIATYKVEAVFAGHVHNIFYHRLAETEFYVVPATSFVRQDYAEMYRVEAALENGRNDAEKLGFAVVDLYSDGHVIHYVRSHGEMLGVDEAATQLPEISSVNHLPHSKKEGMAGFGVFLRHSWAEIVSLPCNGPMDEFHRKLARNDYTLATLWRLGIRKLRVPVTDMFDATLQARMRDLRAIGFEFTVFSFDVPSDQTLARILENKGLFSRFEVVLPRGRIPQLAAQFEKLREKLACPLILAPVSTSADEVAAGSKFQHFVAHGFRPAELPAVDALLAKALLPGVDGFVFRLHCDDDISATVDALTTWSRAKGRDVDCFLRLASTNPAENAVDDQLFTASIVEWFACALANPDLSLTLDNLIDIDRGYFVRNGLADRRYNLRVSGVAVESLVAYFGAKAGAWSKSVQSRVEGRAIILDGADETVVILLPKAGQTMALCDLAFAEDGAQFRKPALDLCQLWTTFHGKTADMPPADRRYPGPTLLSLAPIKATA